jgi:hypothetical protein
LNPYKLEKCNF